MRKNARPETDLFVEITLGEPVTAKLQFRGDSTVQVGVENTKWVQIRNVMSTNLVCTDEQLRLFAAISKI